MGYWLVILLLSIIACVEIETPLQPSPSDSVYRSGVIILDESNFESALAYFHNMVVYFEYPYKCEYCEYYRLVFAMIADKCQTLYQKTHQIQFAKIPFNANTQPIFEKYGVINVPVVKAISSNGKVYYMYSLDYSDAVIEPTVEWAHRVYSLLPESTDSIDKEIVIHCDSDHAEYLNYLRRNELYFYFSCSRTLQKEELRVRGNSITINYKDKKAAYEAIGMAVKRAKCSFIWDWNLYFIHSVFSKGEPIFVMIINNYSRSHGAFYAFNNIRKYLNKEEYYQSIPPIRFVVSDLSRTMQETTDLRRYLTAYALSDMKEYGYPLLSYLHPKEYAVHKYNFPLLTPMNKTSLTAWMTNVIDLIYHSKHFPAESEDLMIPREWFNHDPEEYNDYDFDLSGQTKVMAPLDNSRFGEILQKSPLYPFFVFLFWKNEPLNLVIFSQVRKWYNNEDRLGQFAPLFYFVRNIDELPVHPGLKVDYYPSLVFVNDYKVVTVLDGVTSMNKIKKFMYQHTPNSYKVVKVTPRYGDNTLMEVPRYQQFNEDLDEDNDKDVFMGQKQP